MKKILFLLLFVLTVYFAGRLYYATTGGFVLSNIQAEIPHDPKWDLSPLSLIEKEKISKILDQKFTYFGKGCQAYVFTSEDNLYVIKFFKYQRFRPQAWLNLFRFIPPVEKYQLAKAAEKKEKLEKVLQSWKIAFEELQNETGVLYVHLNKTKEWNKQLALRDKLGISHEVDVDQTEFLLQLRATMLCPAVTQMMKTGEEEQARKLLDRLLAMLFSEYIRGYADNDHALMQNTGVLDGYPIHIDAGQLIKNPVVKAPKIYKQELYDKTYKFHEWLKKRFPSLADHFKNRLVAIIGPDYFHNAPYVHKGDVAKIPHVE